MSTISPLSPENSKNTNSPPSIKITNVPINTYLAETKALEQTITSTPRGCIDSYMDALRDAYKDLHPVFVIRLLLFPFALVYYSLCPYIPKKDLNKLQGALSDPTTMNQQKWLQVIQLCSELCKDKIKTDLEAAVRNGESFNCTLPALIPCGFYDGNQFIPTLLALSAEEDQIKIKQFIFGQEEPSGEWTLQNEKLPYFLKGLKELSKPPKESSFKGYSEKTKRLMEIHGISNSEPVDSVKNGVALLLKNLGGSQSQIETINRKHSSDPFKLVLAWIEQSNSGQDKANKVLFMAEAHARMADLLIKYEGGLSKKERALLEVQLSSRLHKLKKHAAKHQVQDINSYVEKRSIAFSAKETLAKEAEDKRLANLEATSLANYPKIQLKGSERGTKTISTLGIITKEMIDHLHAEINVENLTHISNDIEGLLNKGHYQEASELCNCALRRLPGLDDPIWESDALDRNRMSELIGSTCQQLVEAKVHLNYFCPPWNDESLNFRNARCLVRHMLEIENKAIYAFQSGYDLLDRPYFYLPDDASRKKNNDIMEFIAERSQTSNSYVKHRVHHDRCPIENSNNFFSRIEVIDYKMEILSDCLTDPEYFLSISFDSLLEGVSFYINSTLKSGGDQLKLKKIVLQQINETIRKTPRMGIHVEYLGMDKLIKFGGLQYTAYGRDVLDCTYKKDRNESRHNLSLLGNDLAKAKLSFASSESYLFRKALEDPYMPDLTDVEKSALYTLRASSIHSVIDTLIKHPGLLAHPIARDRISQVLFKEDIRSFVDNNSAYAIKVIQILTQKFDKATNLDEKAFLSHLLLVFTEGNPPPDLFMKEVILNGNPSLEVCLRYLEGQLLKENQTEDERLAIFKAYFKINELTPENGEEHTLRQKISYEFIPRLLEEAHNIQTICNTIAGTTNLQFEPNPNNPYLYTSGSLQIDFIKGSHNQIKPGSVKRPLPPVLASEPKLVALFGKAPDVVTVTETSIDSCYSWMMGDETAQVTINRTTQAISYSMTFKGSRYNYHNVEVEDKGMLSSYLKTYGLWIKEAKGETGQGLLMIKGGPCLKVSLNPQMQITKVSTEDGYQVYSGDSQYVKDLPFVHPSRLLLKKASGASSLTAFECIDYPLSFKRDREDQWALQSDPKWKMQLTETSSLIDQFGEEYTHFLIPLKKGSETEYRFFPYAIQRKEGRLVYEQPTFLEGKPPLLKVHGKSGSQGSFFYLCYQALSRGDLKQATHWLEMVNRGSFDPNEGNFLIDQMDRLFREIPLSSLSKREATLLLKARLLLASIVRENYAFKSVPKLEELANKADLNELSALENQKLSNLQAEASVTTEIVKSDLKLNDSFYIHLIYWMIPPRNLTKDELLKQLELTPESLLTHFADYWNCKDIEAQDLAPYLGKSIAVSNPEVKEAIHMARYLLYNKPNNFNEISSDFFIESKKLLKEYPSYESYFGTFGAGRDIYLIGEELPKFEKAKKILSGLFNNVKLNFSKEGIKESIQVSDPLQSLEKTIQSFTSTTSQPTFNPAIPSDVILADFNSFFKLDSRVISRPNFNEISNATPQITSYFSNLQKAIKAYNLPNSYSFINQASFFDLIRSECTKLIEKSNELKVKLLADLDYLEVVQSLKNAQDRLHQLSIFSFDQGHQARLCASLAARKYYLEHQLLNKLAEKYRNGNLPDDQAKMMADFLIIETTIQQLEKVQELRDPTAIKALLDRTKPDRYNALEEAKRREFLVFEWTQGIILKPEQLVKIDALLNDRNVLEVFRMGMGKTSAVFPLVARLLTLKGFFPIIYLPVALLERSRETMDKRAYVFRFSRQTPIDAVSVRQLYATLLTVASDSRYVLTTIESRAFLKDKIVELTEQLKNSKGNKVILDQLNWLNKIEDLLENRSGFKNSVSLVDEPDEVFHINHYRNYAIDNPQLVDHEILESAQSIFDQLRNHPKYGTVAVLRLPKDQQKARLKEMGEDKELLSKLIESNTTLYNHWLNSTLPLLLDQERNEYGMACRFEGVKVVPLNKGVSIPYTTYGEETELVGHNFCAALYFQPKPIDLFNLLKNNRLLTKPIREKLENGIPLNPDEWVTVQPIFLETLFREGVIQVHRKQIVCNVQDGLNRTEVSGSSGTVNPQSLPSTFKPSGTPDTFHAVTAETLVKLNVADPYFYTNMTKSFTDRDKAMIDLANDQDCVAIINQGESLGDQSTLDLIHILHTSCKRDYVFIHPKFEVPYMWLANSPSFQPFDASKIDSKKALYYYGPADTRGTDFKVGDGYGALFVGPSTTMTDFEQAAWRLRRLGEGQSVQIYSAQPPMPQLDMIIQIGKKTVENNLELNRLRVLGEAKAMSRAILRTDRNLAEKWEQCESYFIQESALPIQQEEEETKKVVLATYQDEANKLQKMGLPDEAHLERMREVEKKWDTDFAPYLPESVRKTSSGAGSQLEVQQQQQQQQSLALNVASDFEEEGDPLEYTDFTTKGPLFESDYCSNLMDATYARGDLKPIYLFVKGKTLCWGTYRDLKKILPHQDISIYHIKEGDPLAIQGNSPLDPLQLGKMKLRVGYPLTDAEKQAVNAWLKEAPKGIEQLALLNLMKKRYVASTILQ